MSISNYGELKTAVENWLKASDLTSRIPEFITIAESMISQDVRVRDMVTRTTFTMSSEYTDISANLPRFLEMRNLQLNTSPTRRLRYVTPEQIDTLYASNGSGKPQVYTIIGDEIQAKPIADSSYTAEAAYYQRYAAFSSDSDENWLLTNHPQIYLYASLIAAEPFLWNDERLPIWSRMYKGEVIAVNSAEKRGQYSGSALVQRADTGNP